VTAAAPLLLQVTGGRNNKGEFPGLQAADPRVPGYATLRDEQGARLPLPADPSRPGTFTVDHRGRELAAGTRLALILGDCGEGSPGIEAPSCRQLDKFLVLSSPPPSSAEQTPPPWAGGSVWGPQTADWIVRAATLHVLGGPARHLRAYAPSMARPGRFLTILVRPEDEWGNLAPQRPGRLRVFAGDAELRATVRRVARSSCLRARVVLPEPGIYRLRVGEDRFGLEAVTNPVVAAARRPPRVYWGLIHGHTEMSDGTGTLKQYFHQLRNEVGLDFAAPGDHDHLWETPDAFWSRTCEAVRHGHAPGRFVTFLGYEWAKWRRNGDGDRNVYYLHDDRPMYRSDDGLYPAPPDLFRALREHQEQAIVIPHHTGHDGNFCDWKDHSPEHERLVEIFQVRGSFECDAADGNPLPERGTQPPVAAGYVQRALALGWRVGFTAGGDDHAGSWGTERRFSGDEHQYQQGLMSVQAGSRTRAALWRGLYARRVVATTGARRLLDFRLNGQPWGSELAAKRRRGLASGRRIEGRFHGTAPVERIDIIRNNEVVHTETGEGRLDVEFTWEDTQPIEQVWLPPARFCDHPFCFYYVRAVQTDGEVAWASPVWIDP